MMTETSFQRANRLADEAKAQARARGSIDYSRYEPLAKVEPLEARDSVETEVWEQIEWEARRWHGIPEQEEEERPDMVEFLSVVREVLIELREEAARERRRMMALREKLALRQATLAFIDVGSGYLVPVEVPLIGLDTGVYLIS